ncbi:MAG: hypothetical protein AAF621_00110 [Pseudomonadota bacterium]
MMDDLTDKIDRFKSAFKDIRGKIITVGDNRKVVNYTMMLNLLLIVGLGSLMLVTEQSAIRNYGDIRGAIGRLKEVSESYELLLIKSQVTLKPDQEEMVEISKRLDEEKKYIDQVSKKIKDNKYKSYLDKFIDVLDRRLAVRDELFARYDNLYDIYNDYRKAANNVEDVLSNKSKLQIAVKNIMLDLESVRLMAKKDNRDDILQNIRQLRAELLNESPEIQSKVGLFTERTKEITQLLRYLDTIRTSMKSDDYNLFLEDLESKTSDHISIEEIIFKLKLFLFFSLAIIIAVSQVILLTWFYVNRRKTDRIKAQAEETMEKSKSIVTRAKQYALDAQRGQYKLLQNFCSDFSTIIFSVSRLSKKVKDDLSHIDEDQLEALGKSCKVNTKTLSSSVGALEVWLKNYLDIHNAREDWRDAVEEDLNISEIVDDVFAQSRFYAGEREHEMALFHGDLNAKIRGDNDYIKHIYMNMVYIVLKWSQSNWVKTSVRLIRPDKSTNDDMMPAEESPKSILEIAVSDTTAQEEFEMRQELFNREETDDDKGDVSDRFVSAALYFSRQIGDILNAKFDLTRTVADENIFKVQIPVDAEEGLDGDIGVPILQNKSAIIVSPYANVLYTLEEQIKNFGMNVTPISDRYAAVGHIVGAKQSNEEFDIVILDHRPPLIDAAVLSKVVRENTTYGLVHIIVITSEALIPSLESSMNNIDAILPKPVKPTDLKATLEYYVEIQLYGSKDIPDMDDEDNTKNFLCIMNEDLSSSLIKLIVTRENYHIDIATTATQVMEALDTNIYDFILISNKGTWIIPDNVINDIRRHHTDNQNSVVILLYDELKEGQMEKLSRSGYDDFIELPLSKAVLLQKIEEWDDPVAKRVDQSEEDNDETSDSEIPLDDTKEIALKDIPDQDEILPPDSEASI